MIIQSRLQLGDLLKELNLPLVICECGVAEGLFSKQIMGWGVEKLYLVDMWKRIEGQHGDGDFPQEWHDNNLQQVRDTMSGYSSDKYVILQGDSSQMAIQVPDNSLSLVYIDADHSYEGVKRDLNAWLSKVVVGGIIAGHDYLNPGYGANRAVNEFATGRFDVIIIP
jgi:hypothetical protein